MKKIAILSLLLFCATPAAMAQQWKMHIYDTNGKELSYDVDSISKLTFTNDTSTPWYYIMDFFSTTEIPSPGEYLIPVVDSLTFGDTLQTKYTVIYTGNQNRLFALDAGKGGIVDSISFSEFETDTNVIQFPITATELSNAVGAAWIGNRIYCAEPDRCFELDSNMHILKDSLIDSASIFGAYPIDSYCLAADSSGMHLLSVSSYGGGRLQEYGIQTGFSKLLDSAYSISNAVYYRGGDDTIIYYSYSSTNPNSPAGYYLFDRKADTNILLLKYISDLGRNELVNGFDVSPDGKTLLLGATSDTNVPKFIEYDLAQHTFDTLPVMFNTATVNPAIWVRYSHDGTKILYSNYPFNVFNANEPVYYPSEIGIIDRATGSRRVLETNPTTAWLWVSLFPEWSPDDTKIVYSCALLYTEPPGYLSSYKICILKSLQ